MKYKVKFDYEIMDVIGFIVLNGLLLVITFGIATPFVILNFIKLVTKGLEVHDSLEVSTSSSSVSSPSWTDIHEGPWDKSDNSPGKMLKP